MVDDVTGVPLNRLLTAVTLSPAEAACVAVRLLESVDVSRAGDGSLPDDRWAVALTPSGSVEVTSTERAGATLAELLGQLSRNARRLPAHPDPDQLVLLRRLEEAAAEPGPAPGARAARLEEALVGVLGASAPERLAAQMADLVGASAHLAASTRAPITAAGAPGEVRLDALPQRRRARAAGRRRVRVRRAALVALLLVAAAAVSGYVLTRRAGDASAGADGRGPTTAAPTGEAPSRTPPTSAERPSSRPRVAALAPRRAGAVTGVELLRAGECRPGTLCAVTVTVRLRPASTLRAVTWRVGTATSCGSDVRWSPQVEVTAQPGWTSVYASSSVPVPQGRSAVLVATTTTPARAQSPPVPATGPSLRC